MKLVELILFLSQALLKIQYLLTIVIYKGQQETMKLELMINNLSKLYILYIISLIRWKSLLVEMMIKEDLLVQINLIYQQITINLYQDINKFQIKRCKSAVKES